jgi:diacylglycerol kinase family enzyme
VAGAGNRPADLVLWDQMPPLETLERLGEAFALDAPTQRKRMLVIVNPYATTVSDRLKNLVVYALQGRYEVDAIDTRAKADAIGLAREAAHEGYDVVVAFGGDGTLNEAANGLAGSPTPLTTLPGGSTNVFCKMLGIPGDIVDATEHLLRIADDWRPQRIDLPRVNDRDFVFSAGFGLDASVVARVDARPRLKARYGPTFFVAAAIATFTSRYTVSPPRIDVALADGEGAAGVTVLVQNGDPYTYFRNRPIHMAEGARLDDGKLAGLVLERSTPTVMPGIVWRAFTGARMVRHRAVTGFSGLDGLTCTSADGRPVALQVDGDFIGEVTEAEFSIRPLALTVVS